MVSQAASLYSELYSITTTAMVGCQPPRSSMNTTAKKKIEHIALGSDRAGKIMAVRASIARIAQADSAWRNVNIVARPVQTDTPAMPLNDWERMSRVRQGAHAVREKQ